MDLDINDLGDLRDVAPAVHPAILAHGALSEDDMLDYSGTPGPSVPQVQKLRQRHHLMAKLEAAGHTNVELSAITGYSTVYVGVLQRNPAYQEILAVYAQEVSDRVMDFSGQLEWLQASVMDRLTDLLENNDKLTPEFIRNCFRDILDRNGHGVSTNHNIRGVVAHLSREDLQDMKAAVKNEDRGLEEEVSEKLVLELVTDGK